MRLEVKQKIDPCLALSANGQHFIELVKDEMKGQIIDRLWELIEPYIHTDESFHEIKITLDYDTLTEKAVDWNNGVPHMYDKQYLKIG